MSIASIIHPYCQKVLPLTYDESLSYYEVLCKLRTKINEVIDVFNSYEEIIKTLEQEVIDIEGLKTAVATLQERTDVIDNLVANLGAEDKNLQKQINELTELVNGVVSGYNEIVEYIDSKYNILSQRIDNLTFKVYADMYTYIHKLEAEIEALSEALAEIDTKLYNPWQRINRKESVQKNFDYAYADLSDLEPTASEYSELGLTANEYNEYELTAYEYSARGKEHLHMFWVFSPTYGFRQEISNVLTSIVNYVSNTLTADEYSLKDMSADDYVALDINAQEYYYWRGESTDKRVIFNPDGTGLTRSQYRHLDVNADGTVSVRDEGEGITSNQYDRLSIDGDNNLVVGETVGGIDRSTYERLEVTER